LQGLAVIKDNYLLAAPPLETFTAFFCGVALLAPLFCVEVFVIALACIFASFFACFFAWNNFLKEV